MPNLCSAAFFAVCRKDDDGDDVFVVALPIWHEPRTPSTSLTYQYLSILSSLPFHFSSTLRSQKCRRRGGGLREEEEEEEEEEEVDNGAIACEAEEEIT